MSDLIGTIIYLIAYIDPGTGSLLLQILLGGFAGLWLILKFFSKRIKRFFGIKSKVRNPEE